MPSLYFKGRKLSVELTDMHKLDTSVSYRKQDDYTALGARPKQGKAGSRPAADEMSDDMVNEVTEYEDRICLSLKDGLLLKYLGFQQNVQNEYSGYDVHVQLVKDVSYLVIKSECASRVDWKDIANSYIVSLKCKEVSLTDDKIKFLFNENNHPNEDFYLFIQDYLRKKHGKDLDFMFVFIRGRDIVRVYSKDDKSASKLVKSIEEDFSYMLAVDVCTEKGRNLLGELKQIGKLYYKKSEYDCLDICCTSDVRKKLDFPDVKHSLAIEIPVSLFDFFITHRKNIIVDMYKKDDVEVRWEKPFVVLLGNTKHLKDGQKPLSKYIKTLSSRSVPVCIPEELIDSHTEEIDKIVQSGQCCWYMKPISKPDNMLSNCEYLATWYDELEDLRICVVKGNPWDIDLDLQVIFTTDSLYPLEIDEDTNKKEGFTEFINRGLELVEKRGSHFTIGLHTRLLDDVKNVGIHHKNYVIGLVVFSDDGKKQASINVSKLQNSLISIFSRLGEKDIKTVGIAGWFIKDSLKIKLVKEFVDFVLAYRNTKKAGISGVTEIVVCVKENNDHVLDEVNDVFKEKHGYCRKVYHADCKQLNNPEPRFEIKVKTDALQDQKVDVLVNTTNKKLKLDSGALSSILLKKAGDKLQQECDRAYPDGIKHGQIAVTQSYNIKSSTRSHNLKKGGCKYIYHVALPPYKYETFTEDIKMYVKKCLCKAARDGCLKIAFPAFGVGNLTYPRREVAHAMISAAEEFCLNAMNLKLKKIKFAVFKDDLTSNAFCDEQWRRSKKFEKECKRPTPKEKTDFNALSISCDHLTVKIATKSECCDMASYVVECFFKTVKGSDCVKRASTDKKTWNDQLFLGSAHDVSTMTRQLEKCHDTFNKERITTAAIHTITGIEGMNESKQVETILEYFKKTTSLSKLKNVIIVVSGEQALEDAAKLLDLDMRVLLHKRKPHSTIELVGDSGDTNKVAGRLQELLVELADITEEHIDGNSEPSESAANKPSTDVDAPGSSVTDTDHDEEHTSVNDTVGDNNIDDVKVDVDKGGDDKGDIVNGDDDKVNVDHRGDVKGDIVNGDDDKVNVDHRGDVKGDIVNGDDDKVNVDHRGDVKGDIVNGDDDKVNVDNGSDFEGFIVNGDDDKVDVDKGVHGKVDDVKDDKMMMDDDVVHAQLNPGIVSMLKNKQQWKRWTIDVKNKFRVEISLRNSDNDNYFVSGSLDDIIEFENHLNQNIIDEKKETTH